MTLRNRPPEELLCVYVVEKRDIALRIVRLNIESIGGERGKEGEGDGEDWEEKRACTKCSWDRALMVYSGGS